LYLKPIVHESYWTFLKGALALKAFKSKGILSICVKVSTNKKVYIFNVFFIFPSLGDPRRPYPLDIEMRCGALGQLSQKRAGDADITDEKSSDKKSDKGITGL